MIPCISYMQYTHICVLSFDIWCGPAPLPSDPLRHSWYIRYVYCHLIYVRSWTPFLWPSQTLKISKISVISIDIHRHSRYLRYLQCLEGMREWCTWMYLDIWDIWNVNLYIYRHHRYLRYLQCLEGVREWCTWMSIGHSYISHLFMIHVISLGLSPLTPSDTQDI